jgi:hypothetical protein
MSPSPIIQRYRIALMAPHGSGMRLVGRAEAARGYSSIEVCRLAGVTYRVLDYLIRCGHLRPAELRDLGSGAVRRFSAEDLGVVWALGSFRAVGLRGDAFARAADYLNQGWVDWSAGGFLVVDIDGAVIVTDRPDLAITDRGVCTVLALDTAEVLERVAM